MTHCRTVPMLLLAGLLLFPARVVGQIHAPPGAGHVYRWVDEQGVVHYTQGIDNVPERYRGDPTLSPPERTVAGEALAALRALESLVAPDMGSVEYQWRLRRLDEIVPRKLRAMKKSSVRTALAAALGHYRAAAPVVARNATGSGDRAVRSDPSCPRLARLSAPGDRPAAAEVRTAALRSLWGCASDQLAAAQRMLAVTPGSAPRAERIPMPPRPRR